MKIRYKIIISISLIILIGGGAALFFATRLSEQALKNSIGSNSSLLARQSMDSVDRQIYRRIERWESYLQTRPNIYILLAASNQQFATMDNRETTIASRDSQWIAASDDQITALMADWTDAQLSDSLKSVSTFYEEQYGYKLFPEVFITNQYGVNIAQTNMTSDYYQADEEWWQQAKIRGIYVSDASYDESSQIYSISLCLRIDDNDNFLGVMKVVYDIHDIISIIDDADNASYVQQSTGDTSSAAVETTAVYSIINADGKLIYSTDKSAGQYLNSISNEVFSSITGNSQTNFFTHFDSEIGEDDLYSFAKSNGYRSYQGLGWVFILEHKTSEVYAPVTALGKHLWLIIGGACVLAVLLGLLLSGYITRPIEKLKRSTDIIKNGNLNHKAALLAHDEIGDLSRSFDLMTNAIKESRKDVDRKVQEQTKTLSSQKLELEKQQNAMLNILKDVDQEKRKFESLLESIGDGVIATDHVGKILFINKPAAEMLGYEQDTVAGKKLVDVVKILNNERIALLRSLRPAELARKTLKRQRGEYYYVRSNGSSFPTSITVTPVIIASKLIGTIEVFRDITRERKNEQDLQKFHLAVDGASDHIVITNFDGIIVYMNSAAEKITGFSKTEALGKKAGSKELWGGMMDSGFYKIFWKTIKVGKKVFIGIIKNKRKNGEIYDAAVNVSPILDKHGNVQFFVGIERDVSKELAIDRAKTEFVSLASHQLRTPLSAINWYTEMLLAGDAGKLTKEQKSFLDEIYHSNQRMVSLVNSLLNVSRLELGTFMVEPEKTDIPEIVDSIIGELRPLIAKKKQAFTKKYDKTLPIMMLDKKLIRMVIQNLLTNALKYTPEKGKISLTIGKDAKKLTITVSDTGMGIPESQQSEIFKKLFRADNVREADTEGTGLGLYIVKAIVTHAGGKVWFTSVENKGTTFYVQIPLSGMTRKTGTKTLA